MTPARLHATCVAIGEQAVLLIGASGSGKSDLALRLIDRGATLVSDDQTLLTVAEGTLTAAPPATIAGLIEVRGIGIIPLPHRAAAPVALVVRLGEPVMRMPEASLSETINGIAIPLVRVDSHEASAPLKVELALRRVTGGTS
ncbi:HPr kinase/phosphatase C-terminal domain-containing protein [Sphingomonas sp. H39-1-10]|uniref:HPr kinase/phosphorylase n=1 Tax=Sphingomonas TaxID=13687 RepID=UPI00088BA5BE|nr:MULTISPECIES: HPr kinase/phosphatase C-terminal domain-containing protein [Sphingomonas]MDF0488470.1 HPr kinase/phosphatase C-terminal domain-containing protein [Sphingomonas pollutisoli]SDA11189.1 Hpr(Ser) kinase/phosphatase [Sphingomonas sp. NFR15]